MTKFLSSLDYFIKYNRQSLCGYCKAPAKGLLVEKEKDIYYAACSRKHAEKITHYYNQENLKGKQVIGVCNFPEKNIAGVVSQVLILGSIDKEGKVILVHPSQKSENGLPIA